MTSLFQQLKQCDEELAEQHEMVTAYRAKMEVCNRTIEELQERRAAVKRQLGVDDEAVLQRVVKRNCTYEDTDAKVKRLLDASDFNVMWKYKYDGATTYPHCRGDDCPYKGKMDEYDGYYQYVCDEDKYFCDICIDCYSDDVVYTKARVELERARKITKALIIESNTVDDTEEEQEKRASQACEWRHIKAGIAGDCTASAGCSNAPEYYLRASEVCYCAVHYPLARTDTQ